MNHGRTARNETNNGMYKVLALILDNYTTMLVHNHWAIIQCEISLHFLNIPSNS